MFPCKNCGQPIELTDESVVVCRHCGTQQVPPARPFYTKPRSQTPPPQQQYYPQTPPPQQQYQNSRPSRPQGSGKGKGALIALLLVAVVIVGVMLYLKFRHRHEFAPADCDSPRTCQCGKTEGLPLGHEYMPATENNPSYCRYCGDTVGLTLKEQRDEECQQWLDSAAALVADKQYRKAIELLSNSYASCKDARLYWQMNEYRREMANFNNRVICAGKNNTVVISNGVISMCGDTRYKEMGANGWGGILAVAMGDKHLVALKQDGSVDAVGISVDKQYEGIKGLTGVAALSAGDFHSVALMRDGTVRSSKGYNHAGQCAVDSLMLAAGGKEIVAVSAAYDHTVALLEDGTAVAVGDKKAYNNPVNGSCNVGYWKDIAAVYSGSEYSAGLRIDGTVVLSGVNWDVSGWTDIVNMAAGDYYLVGVREDGTVLAVGDPYEGNSQMGYAHVNNLKDVVYISAGHDHTVAVDKYGVVHCIGSNEFGQCDLNGMKID